MACRYSFMSMCSSKVWSRCESPGPSVTMGRFISTSKGTTLVALPPTTLTKHAVTALYGLAEGSSDGYEEAFLICSQSSYAFSKALSYSQGVEECPVSVLQTILSWICPL